MLKLLLFRQSGPAFAPSWYIVGILLFLVAKIESFVVPQWATCSRLPPRCSNQPVVRVAAMGASSSNSENNEEEEWFDDWNTSNLNINGPEKSQMYDYISDFLRKENQDEGASDDDEQPQAFTHLIAIPMGACHELAIELESVQRAILYHCPVLVHACIVPSITRIPLLYVKAGRSSSQSTKSATECLHQIVQEVVQKHIFVQATKEQIQEENRKSSNDQDEAELDGRNEEGIKPLMLNFQSLEIDGSNNQALHTVALPDDPGTRRLQQLVLDLQETIQTRLNWETSLPPDEHIKSSSSENDEAQVFRPRVPFMRIPPDFEQYLDPLPEGRDEAFRTTDEGGNGISPIFWCNWWDDDFGTARLREIGIYHRSGVAIGLSENAFHLPQQLTILPDGNAALTKQEAKFEKYQDQRLKQMEYDSKQDMQEKRSLRDSTNTVDENDPMLEKTRARLESIYKQGIDWQETSPAEPVIDKKDKDPDRPKVDTSILDDWTQERIRKANAARGLTMYDEEDDFEDDIEVSEDISKNTEPSVTDDLSKKSKGTPLVDGNNDSNQLDDWTRERIRKAIESRQVIQSRQKLAEPTSSVPIEENQVFQKFKDGTLIPDSQKKEIASGPEMPPFPSREHFVGFWRVMSSPTGFPPDDGGGDSSKSENLVLRVDGTTAGGPILDPETNQKAAGGTWKVTTNDNDEETADLRIRLVIPPKKERVLVMQGTATKRSLISLKDLPPRTRATFGIPALEEKLNKAKEADESLAAAEEEMLYCNGKVSIWLGCMG
jgi:hypothetical protein